VNEWLALVFSHPQTVHDGLIIALKTAIIYVFLVAGLRLLGKRELGQMTVYDLVLMIVLANAVQNAMVGDDNTLFGGIISATTLIVLNGLLRFALQRWSRFETALVGQPVVLVNDGRLMTEAMAREGISREQMMAALREHGLERVEDAHICVLEVDGAISVVPSHALVHRTRRTYRALRLN
jgi:uncharacterized membrane protein YcaP (DUF421 family)